MDYFVGNYKFTGLPLRFERQNTRIFVKIHVKRPAMNLPHANLERWDAGIVKRRLLSPHSQTPT